MPIDQRAHCEDGQLQNKPEQRQRDAATRKRSDHQVAGFLFCGGNRDFTVRIQRRVLYGRGSDVFDLDETVMPLVFDQRR
jgi:hypothetical protein